MDYEKKYKEALERAEDFKNGIVQFALDPGESIVHYIFPELRELEDERIRKAIVHLLKVASEAYLIEATGFKKEQFLSYLEKQKEQEHICDSAQYEEGFKTGLEIGLRKQKEQKPVDDDPLNDPRFIDGFDTGREVQKIFDEPAEWSEEDEENFKWFEKFFRAESVIAGGRDIPQDKYLWFKSLRPQPKAEWSKEDENKIERLAFLVSVVAEKEMISEEECFDLRRFVKSYRPQSKQEWSEKDEKVYNNALDALYYEDVDDVLSALKDLCDLISRRRKIIPPCARYRPSEEQKEALQRAIDCLDSEYGEHPEELDSLLNDLYKL